MFVQTPEENYEFDTDGKLLSHDSAPERVHTQVRAYLAEVQRAHRVTMNESSHEDR